MKSYSFQIISSVVIVVTVLCIGLPACQNKPIKIAEEGKTEYTVIQAYQASEPEKFAVKELCYFLEKVTGTSFPMKIESSFSGDEPGIYVGWTEYANREGIDASMLREEEWVIRSIGRDIVITGGRPRGTLYGVYEFLEKQVNCHWLDKFTEIIPSKPTLKLDELDIQNKPWFWIRDLYVSQEPCPDNQWKFLIRNKNYRYWFDGRNDFFPERAFYPLEGSPAHNHTFSYYINASDWFESHPEYFSLNKNGERVPANDTHGPGQLCLTNLDVRQLTIKKLREFINADRDEATKKGYPPPCLYDISQNDVYDAHCQCKNCQAIVRREGSESGPLIDFINHIAQEIETDYPDLLIQTFAYNQTSIPPKNIRPRHNVIIRWCDVYNKCDGIRPLKDSLNSRNYNEIISWGVVAKRLAIWDYWTSLSYYYNFPTPWAMIKCVGSDIKLFADQGAEIFFAETYDYQTPGQHFVRLKLWLAYQLLVNPHQPIEPLIKIFMDGYYGEASKKMKEYLDYLRQRIDNDAQFKLLRDAPHNLAYLDLDFFLISEKIFDEAQALVEPGSLYDLNIRDERLILDGALLYLWPWMDRKLALDKVMPFDHEKIIKRYEKNWRSYRHFSNYYTDKMSSSTVKGMTVEKMVALFRDPVLPEQFQKLPPRDVADFNWLTFSYMRPSQIFINDPDAAGSMTASISSREALIAARLGIAPPDESELFRKPLLIGATGGITLTVKPKDIHQDGKYHVYNIGLIDVKPGTMIWALEGRRLGVYVDRLYVPDAEDSKINTWNVFISLKVKGPAYVKGSTDPNGVWMDRVLLVRSQK